MPTTNPSSQPSDAPLSSKLEGETGASFALHLEHASALVQSWPEWKQQVLGSLPVPSQATGSDRR